MRYYYLPLVEQSFHVGFRIEANVFFGPGRFVARRRFLRGHGHQDHGQNDQKHRTRHCSGQTVNGRLRWPNQERKTRYERWWKICKQINNRVQDKILQVSGHWTAWEPKIDEFFESCRCPGGRRRSQDNIAVW